MKCITLYQPWATLMALGYKSIETRGWATDYRGEMGIHAGKKVDREAFQRFKPVLSRHGYNKPEDLPTGKIVARGILRDCRKICPRIDTRTGGPKVELWRPGSESEFVPACELPYGDYRTGRYGWMFSSIIPFTPPIPARGQQGIWDYKHVRSLEKRPSTRD